MHHPIVPPGKDPVSPSPVRACPSLQDLLDGARAAQRHTTQTALPADVRVHRTAIEATARLRDAILDRNVESATAALGCGAWTDMEFASHSPDEEDRFTHLTLMSLAVLVDTEAHALGMLPLLAGHGGNLNQVDSSGRTLLHFADDLHVARWLLEHGANPDLVTDAEDLELVLPAQAIAAVAAWRLGAVVPDARAAASLPNRL